MSKEIQQREPIFFYSGQLKFEDRFRGENTGRITTIRFKNATEHPYYRKNPLTKKLTVLFGNGSVEIGKSGVPIITKSVDSPLEVTYSQSSDTLSPR